MAFAGLSIQMFKGSQSLTSFCKFNLDHGGLCCFVEAYDTADFAIRLSKLCDVRRRYINGKVRKNEFLGFGCCRDLVGGRIDPKADGAVQDMPLHNRMVEDL